MTAAKRMQDALTPRSISSWRLRAEGSVAGSAVVAIGRGRSRHLGPAGTVEAHGGHDADQPISLVRRIDTLVGTGPRTGRVVGHPGDAAWQLGRDSILANEDPDSHLLGILPEMTIPGDEVCLDRRVALDSRPCQPTVAALTERLITAGVHRASRRHRP